MTSFYLLVADDHLELCKLLQYTVQLVYKEKVRYVHVQTVPDLYNALAPEKPLPDVLLLDYYLLPLAYKAPDVLEWIKHQKHLQQLVVNVWSSLPYGPEAKSCLQLGAQRFTSKSDAFSDMILFSKQLIEANSKREGIENVDC